MQGKVLLPRYEASLYIYDESYSRKLHRRVAITNASNVVFVQRAAGVFRSVWKVGSRWSSLDRLFEPRVSLSGCFQGGQNEETFEFRFQEQMQNAIQQRYPFQPLLFSISPFSLSLSLFNSISLDSWLDPFDARQVTRRCWATESMFAD